MTFAIVRNPINIPLLTAVCHYMIQMYKPANYNIIRKGFKIVILHNYFGVIVLNNTLCNKQQSHSQGRGRVVTVFLDLDLRQIKYLTHKKSSEREK